MIFNSNIFPVSRCR